MQKRRSGFYSHNSTSSYQCQCPCNSHTYNCTSPTPFNFQKADWISFTTDLQNQIYTITPSPKNYKLFTNLVQNIARKHIPRGCLTRYVPCLNEESLNMLDKYKTLYKEDPFVEDTIPAGKQLMASMNQERQRKWLDTIESMGTSRNSKKAWNLIRKLNSNPAISKHQHYPITANQVAHQLLVNRQTKEKKASRVKFKKHEKQNMESNLTSPFTVQEFSNSIAALKNGKAIDLDGIFTEELKHFGQQAKQWFLELFNRCVETNRIPKIWRKSRVVVLPKPGKDLLLPKSFRPISLLPPPPCISCWKGYCLESLPQLWNRRSFHNRLAFVKVNRRLDNCSTSRSTLTTVSKRD